MTVFYIAIGTIIVTYGVLGYLLVRNAKVCEVRIAFIRDDSLFPHFFELLPSYGEMLFGIRHQLRWTKAHWVEFVRTI